jgi:hypothetical protein
VSLIKTFDIELGSTLTIQDNLISRYLTACVNNMFPNKAMFIASEHGGEERVAAKRFTVDIILGVLQFNLLEFIEFWPLSQK